MKNPDAFGGPVPGPGPGPTEQEQGEEQVE